ncbi:MAG: DinB family protein [Thermomicrobiales bacterium]
MSAQAVLQELVRHNTWANRWLIAFCDKLDPVALEWTTSGTYGSIHATIQHTVLAEEGYVWRLKEKGPRPAADPTLLSLMELDGRAQAVGDELVSYLGHGQGSLGSREGQSPEGVVSRYRPTSSCFSICIMAMNIGPMSARFWAPTGSSRGVGLEFAEQTGKIRRA